MLQKVFTGAVSVIDGEIQFDDLMVETLVQALKARAHRGQAILPACPLWEFGIGKGLP